MKTKSKGRVQPASWTAELGAKESWFLEYLLSNKILLIFFYSTAVLKKYRLMKWIAVILGLPKNNGLIGIFPTGYGRDSCFFPWPRQIHFQNLGPGKRASIPTPAFFGQLLPGFLVFFCHNLNRKIMKICLYF
jgi:hypothetical protein